MLLVLLPKRGAHGDEGACENQHDQRMGHGNEADSRCRQSARARRDKHGDGGTRETHRRGGWSALWARCAGRWPRACARGGAATWCGGRVRRRGVRGVWSSCRATAPFTLGSSRSMWTEASRGRGGCGCWLSLDECAATAQLLLSVLYVLGRRYALRPLTGSSHTTGQQTDGAQDDDPLRARSQGNRLCMLSAGTGKVLELHPWSGQQLRSPAAVERSLLRHTI